jgi:hypothetical protein
MMRPEREPTLNLAAGTNMKKPTYDKASEVVADDGQVLVDGPDGVDVALTPEAALETGSRLMDAAGLAAGQERDHEKDQREEP